MRVLSLTLSALTLAVSAAAAQIANTGEGSLGGLDPNWTFTCSVTSVGLASSMAPCDASGQAFIPADIPSPPWQANTGTAAGPNWIAAWTDASSSTGTGNNATNYEYDFSTAVGVAGTYKLSLGWDNQLIGIYQGGTQLLGPSVQSAFCRDGDGLFPSGGSDCLESESFTLKANEDLVIKILGDGTTDGIYVGVDRLAFREAVVTPEPATMGLLATGLVGLMGAGVSRRRKR